MYSFVSQKLSDLMPVPANAIINDKIFDVVNKLSSLSPFFDSLADHIVKNYHEWEVWVRHKGMEHCPENFDDKLPPFEKLILIKLFKPDMLSKAVEQYLIDRIGNTVNQVSEVNLNY